MENSLSRAIRGPRHLKRNVMYLINRPKEETLNKKWEGLTFMGCNCVHVSIPARGVWRYAPPGNFLHIRSAEFHSDAFCAPVKLTIALTSVRFPAHSRSCEYVVIRVR